MNGGQKMFHDFYMKMVKSGSEGAAEKLLAEGFQRQDEGTFDGAYFASVRDAYFSLIDEKYTDQLTEAMNHFAGK